MVVALSPAVMKLCDLQSTTLLLFCLRADRDKSLNVLEM